MKKIIVLLILLAIIPGLIWAEGEDVNPPLLTLNMILKDAVAFPGLGLELLLGRIGIGGTFTLFFLAADANNAFFIYEPGLYLHLYFFEPEASLYALVDISFAGIGVMSGGDTATSENNGLGNLNVGLGFNGFFGDKKNIHFSFEMGARYMTWIIQGDAVDTPFDVFLPIIPHLQLQFGMGLF